MKILFCILLVCAIVLPTHVSAARPLEGRIIILDPGHGLGASNVFAGYDEQVRMLALSRMIENELVARGATVHKTRTTGANVLNQARVAMMNRWSLEFLRAGHVRDIEVARAQIVQSEETYAPAAPPLLSPGLVDRNDNGETPPLLPPPALQGEQDPSAPPRTAPLLLPPPMPSTPVVSQPAPATPQPPTPIPAPVPPAVVDIDALERVIAAAQTQIAELDRLIALLDRIIANPQRYAPIYMNVPFDSTLNTRIHPTWRRIFELQGCPTIADTFLAISLHSNASSSTSIHGADVFFAGNNNPRNMFYFNQYSHSANMELFGDILLDGIHAIGINRRSVTNHHWLVIRETNLPAVLVENGFHTNDRDRGLLQSDSFLARLAVVYANSIEAYFTRVAPR